MDKNSQYLPPSGQQTSQPQRGLVDRFYDIQDKWKKMKQNIREGWEHPDFNQRDWAMWDQRFLNMREWLKRNPGKTQEDFRAWKRSLPRGRWN